MNKNLKKSLVFIIIIFSCSVPILVICSLIPSSAAIDENPVIQAFSKDNYSPILEEKLQALGNITITDVAFNEEGFFNNSLHPEIGNDYSSGALEMNYQGTNFLEIVEIAQYNNLEKDMVRSNKIKILLNESLSVNYNASVLGSEKYLIYGFRLSAVSIRKIYVHNQTSDPIIELTSEEYSIDKNNFINFDYFDYFQANVNNFSIYILYEYSLTIQNWLLLQDPEQDLLMNKQEQTFSPRFTYNFTLTGNKYNKTINDVVPAFNFQADINLSLPDKGLLYEHSLKINDLSISEFLGVDNSINFTTFADFSEISISFNSNFTLRFVSPIHYSWAIDRLASFNNIRERIYVPNLISGPDHIYIEGVSLFENTITIDQVLDNYSVFGRSLVYSDANVSIIEEKLQNSLIFTKNSIKKKGLKIIIPYLIKGESNPCIIKYQTNNDIRLIITDNIYMPLINIRVELFYFDKPYGTYISNDLVHPMAPAYSSDQGEVIIYNVPNGVYNVRIYQNEELLLETEVSSFSDVNYIATEILHFPIIILVFLGMYSIIFIFGIGFYLKNKRR